MKSCENLYILRYTMPPEPARSRPERLADLLGFCRQGCIDEVMFFLLPEEYNRGQYRKEHYAPWLEHLAWAKEALEREGIDVSLNPWATIHPVDKGRTSGGLDFRRMVLDNGYVNLSSACPLCEKWLAIFTDAFADFARAGFRTIYLEDDFRFHNHNGLMGWGGCFCEHHLNVLKGRGLSAANREELVTHICAAGPAHPDRLLWMDLNQETYMMMARRVRQAIDAVDPQVNLGLMTSHIGAHAIEGREWHALIEALGGAQRVPIRPHGAGYSECCRQALVDLSANTWASLSVLPQGTRSFFEVENYPMSRFSKSNQQTGMQMAQALDAGCDGLTLNVLDFLGNGPESEPAMAGFLGSVRPRLTRLRELNAGLTPMGVQILQPVSVTRHAPGCGGRDINSLPTVNYGWFSYLKAQGYPCTIQTSPSQLDLNALCALCGAAVWAIDQQILQRQLCQGRTLIDATAMDILYKRGLAHCLGVERMSWHEREKSCFSMEERIGSENGTFPERATLNVPMKDFSVATYELNSCAQPHTHVINDALEPMGNGAFFYANTQGGRGYVLPTAMPFALDHYSWMRKRWLDDAMHRLGASSEMPYVADAPWVTLSAHHADHRTNIFLANNTFECYESLTLHMPEALGARAWRVELHGRGLGGEIEKLDPRRVRVHTELTGNDWVFLTTD